MAQMERFVIDSRNLTATDMTGLESLECSNRNDTIIKLHCLPTFPGLEHVSEHRAPQGTMLRSKVTDKSFLVAELFLSARPQMMCVSVSLNLPLVVLVVGVVFGAAHFRFTKLTYGLQNHSLPGHILIREAGNKKAVVVKKISARPCNTIRVVHGVHSTVF
jgi:hypothetical protein